MKKIAIIIINLMFALPVFAACPITGGACTASSNWEAKPLQQRLVPDRLQDLQRTDAFKPNYFKPYNEALINTEEETSTIKPPTSDYNSNCQFGVCLPGAEGGGSVLE